MVADVGYERQETAMPRHHEVCPSKKTAKQDSPHGSIGNQRRQRKRCGKVKKSRNKMVDWQQNTIFANNKPKSK